MTIRSTAIALLTVSAASLLVLAGLDLWISIGNSLAAHDPSIAPVTGFGTDDPRSPLIAMQIAFLTFILTAIAGAVCWQRAGRRTVASTPR